MRHLTRRFAFVLAVITTFAFLAASPGRAQMRGRMPVRPTFSHGMPLPMGFPGAQPQTFSVPMVGGPAQHVPSSPPVRAVTSHGMPLPMGFPGTRPQTFSVPLVGGPAQHVPSSPPVRAGVSLTIPSGMASGQNLAQVATQSPVTIFQQGTRLVGPGGRTTQQRATPTTNVNVNVNPAPQVFAPHTPLPYGTSSLLAGAYSPLAYMSPYGGYGGGYGGGGGGYGGGGSRQSGQNSYDNSPQAPAGNQINNQQVPPERQGNAVNPLDALGLPNQEGRLAWPLGLRLLPPSQGFATATTQLDALLQMAGRQLASGAAVDARVVRQAGQDVKRLRRLLNESEYRMASKTYDESRRFLKQLDEALALMQPPAPAQGE